jgi:hypothetical protein
MLSGILSARSPYLWRAGFLNVLQVAQHLISQPYAHLANELVGDQICQTLNASTLSSEAIPSLSEQSSLSRIITTHIIKWDNEVTRFNTF